MKPYIDSYIDNRTFLRKFEDVDEKDLIWHEDLRDREVEVLKVGKWSFQFDNQMPFELKKGDIIKIPKNEIHRLILHEGNLLLKISEIDL